MTTFANYLDTLGPEQFTTYTPKSVIPRPRGHTTANDPARQAQILENRRLEAEYARIEHEQRLQMMADRQSSLPTLANFAPTPQMGGGLLGQQPQQMQQMPQQQMPQQQMQQQPQGINPYALHRGSQGGMGLMGGGLTRGGVAPAGGGQ